MTVISIFLFLASQVPYHRGHVWELPVVVGNVTKVKFIMDRSSSHLPMSPRRNRHRPLRSPGLRIFGHHHPTPLPERHSLICFHHLLRVTRLPCPKCTRPRPDKTSSRRDLNTPSIIQPTPITGIPGLDHKCLNADFAVSGTVINIVCVAFWWDGDL